MILRELENRIYRSDKRLKRTNKKEVKIFKRKKNIKFR